MNNIFETASRQAVRFTSVRGALSTEDLWAIPLKSTDGFNLNAVAQMVSRDLKALGEESFVDEGESPGRALLTLRLDIVKHIIAVKQAQVREAATRAANKIEQQKILAALADKEEQALLALTPAKLRARLKELGGV